MLYNSDLLKIPDVKLREKMLLFVDDAVMLVTGKDFTVTHKKLHTIMTRTNGIFNWAALYNCEFRIEKFQLLDFTKKLVPHLFNSRRNVATPHKALRLSNHCIPSTDTAKFLGMILDNKLLWKAQSVAALTKVQDWFLRFSRIAKTTKNVHAKYLQQLYLSTAIPHILHAANIFLTPQQHTGKRLSNGKPTLAVMNKLATIHRKVVILITGALSTTDTDTAMTLANLPPFHTIINNHHHNAAI